MKKLVSVFLLLCLAVSSVAITACAETVSFFTAGERYSNGIVLDSRAKKADSERNFYVTIEGATWWGDGDRVYFGPRREISTNTYSGALCDGLSYYSGKNTKLKMAYYTSANIPSGSYYCCNVKQWTDGPGTLFWLDVKWTP